MMQKKYTKVKFVFFFERQVEPGPVGLVFGKSPNYNGIQRIIKDFPLIFIYGYT